MCASKDETGCTSCVRKQGWGRGCMQGQDRGVRKHRGQVGMRGGAHPLLWLLCALRDMMGVCKLCACKQERKRVDKLCAQAGM